jgi:hypothetical protein
MSKFVTRNLQRQLNHVGNRMNMFQMRCKKMFPAEKLQAPLAMFIVQIQNALYNMKGIMRCVINKCSVVASALIKSFKS